jgi:hypothetical protein
MILAPGASSHAVWAPAQVRQLPLDEHAVTPEGREEIIAGRRVVAAPAQPEHGDVHSQIDTVMFTNVRPGYVTSSDMLTRCSEDNDFASDTSVRRAGIDPATGQRYLEELAFEVVNTQSLRDVTDKATAMTARGVRRVFAVLVRKGEVREWNGNQWTSLPLDGSIEDAVLAAPVATRALLEAAASNAAAVHGLLARKDPTFLRIVSDSEQRAEKRGELRGELRAQRAMLRQGITARGFTLDEKHQVQLEACDDAAQIERWHVRCFTASTLDAVFADDAP